MTEICNSHIFLQDYLLSPYVFHDQIFESHDVAIYSSHECFQISLQ